MKSNINALKPFQIVLGYIFLSYYVCLLKRRFTMRHLLTVVTTNVMQLHRLLCEKYFQRKIKCPNSEDGCCLYIKMSELEKHEKECPYKEMACPLAAVYGQCQWRGKLPQISKHFNELHPIHCQGDVDTEMCLRNTESQIVYYVMLGTFNFLFHVKVSEYDRKIYMTVQLIGTNISAQKWSYEIHIYNKDQPRRKYQYTDICHSNNTPLMDIFADEKCATLPFAFVDTFVNRDILNYKFYIKKNIESKPSNRQGVRRRN
ncbi:unnamed protein product [Diatraea saccharalis]|uniref:E3 ubiquitin-protein ligase n=1 Tax=Diatraea saccharalis TaxID=40085 RepID=A0A9P0C8A8_9NEOP|nr:unnamed protein product [Diatraea saccharalis]